jgi:hypothetical protein
MPFNETRTDSERDESYFHIELLKTHLKQIDKSKQHLLKLLVLLNSRLRSSFPNLIATSMKIEKVPFD